MSNTVKPREGDIAISKFNGYRLCVKAVLKRHVVLTGWAHTVTLTLQDFRATFDVKTAK